MQKLLKYFSLEQTGGQTHSANSQLQPKIREELGMKPLSRDKFPSLSSPSTRESRPSLKKVPSDLLPMLL